MREELREVLVDGLDYMKRVSKSLHLVREAVNSNDKSVVDTAYEQLSEGLVWVSDALENFAHFLEFDYSELSVRKQSAVNIIDEYRKFMEKVKDSYEKGQYKAYADMIEEDLPKHFTKLTSVFNKVKEIMKNKEN